MTDEKQEFTEGLVTCGVMIAIVVAALYLAGPWVYATFFNPNAGGASVNNVKATITAHTRAAHVFPGSEPRLEFFKTGSVDIFIHRKDWEAIPFPDRELRMKYLCLGWGVDVQHDYWPVLRVRDVVSGQILVEYSARWDRLKIHEPGH